MAQSKHDPNQLKNRLESKLPDHWVVRARYRRCSSERRIEVVLRANSTNIMIRPFRESWKVTGNGPEIARGCLRIAHPDDDPDLALDRCIDRAVASALQFSETGTLQ